MNRCTACRGEELSDRKTNKVDEIEFTSPIKRLKVKRFQAYHGEGTEIKIMLIRHMLIRSSEKPFVCSECVVYTDSVHFVS